MFRGESSGAWTITGKGQKAWCGGSMENRHNTGQVGSTPDALKRRAWTVS